MTVLRFDDPDMVMLPMANITDLPTTPTTWTDNEIARGRAHYDVDQSYNITYSKFNPTPGTYG